jgi:hypothetical protein
MGNPYRRFEDGELIRSEDWNQIQTIIKQEIRTHRHGGGAEGEADPAKLGARLRSEALLDDAVTTEKIAENAVSARVLAPGSVGVAQFRPDAAIDESKVAFDPDEPAAHATAKVVLRIPDALAATPGLLWAIPKGTPVTNDAGDLVFRTSDPVTLDAQKTSVEVAARAEEIGAQGNVPAGTLTRIGGALDPFLRNHLRIAQLGPSQGGTATTSDLPPQIAWTEAELRTEDITPPTFWVVPKGTRVWHQPDDGGAPIVAVTRQSLSVFPRSAWVLAECTTAGAGGNVPAGSIRTVRDSALAPRVTVDQPEPGTGGDAGVPARVHVRLRLYGALAGTPLAIPAGMEVESVQGLVFRTLAAVSLDAGGADQVLANLEDPARPLPAGSLTVDPATRFRLDKIHDPTLVRYVSAQADESFSAPSADPEGIRLRFAFSARAPHSAWGIAAGARVTVSRTSQPGSADDPNQPVPVFETRDARILVPRSGWVRADALAEGSDFNLPAGTLNTVVSLPANPALAASLEVDQPVDAAGGGPGAFAQVAVRFRVIESVPLPPGLSFWEIPTGTVISDGQGKSFATREPLLIDRGGSARVPVQSLAPGAAGNVPAGTLVRIHPDTVARMGNVVDGTLVPYLRVTQPEDAAGGGEDLRRARTEVVISVSERAPRTAWLVPRDTRVARASDPKVVFESIDPAGILPRTGWALAAPVDDDPMERLPARTLDQLIQAPVALAGLVEVYQPAQGANSKVRVWFRVIPEASPTDGTGWRIPAGTIVGNARGVEYATLVDVVIGEGGAGLAILEADRSGPERNGITDLQVLASSEDFEKHVLVTQPAPAKEGADGGSQGHHHKIEDGALASTPLAAQCVGPEQLAQGALSWSKLSPTLAARLKSLRDQLKAVEDAMVEAGALQTLMKQRHQSGG